MKKHTLVIIMWTLLSIVAVAVLSQYLNKVTESAASKEVKLKKIILEVIADHKSELVQFGEHNGEKMDYLTPFINSYYEDGDCPKKSVLRSLLKEALESNGIDPTDGDKLKEIALEVIKEHAAELPALGDHTGDKVDYLTPFIHAYYEEGNYPAREFLRSTVREILEGGEY